MCSLIFIYLHIPFIFLLNLFVWYDPLQALSCLPTPKEWKHYNALVNGINRDGKCIYGWYWLRYMRQEVILTVSTITNKLKWHKMDDISYPVKLRDTDKFESLNENASVNVFAYKEKEATS